MLQLNSGSSARGDACGTGAGSGEIENAAAQKITSCSKKANWRPFMMKYCCLVDS